MSSVQANVGKDKQENPDRYCPERRCLWRVRDRNGKYIGPCGKHGDLRVNGRAAADAMAEAMMDAQRRHKELYG